jgi:hypothetical protein
MIYDLRLRAVVRVALKIFINSSASARSLANRLGGNRLARSVNSIPNAVSSASSRGDGNLIDEVGSRFSAECSAVVGRHRTAAARNLIRNGSTGSSIGQRICKLQHANGKLHRSFFKFSRIHIASVSPPRKNHQS